MNSRSFQLTNAPAITDQAASEMLAFLYEFVDAFEQAYGMQIDRYEEHCEQQPDLFEDFEDDILF